MVRGTGARCTPCTSSNTPALSITEPGPEEGGSLYTWGAIFTWRERRKDKKGAVSSVPDSHRGCLGLGDTEGRHLPTRCVIRVQSTCLRHAGCRHLPTSCTRSAHFP